MKIPTPVALGIIVVVLIVAGFFGYRQYEKDLGIVPEVEKTASYPPYYTEEAWTVQQVAQFIADLSSLAHQTPLTTITAKVQSSDKSPATYALAGGKQKQTLSLDQGVWNPSTYSTWAKSLFHDVKASTDDPATISGIPQALLDPDLQVLLAQNTAISKLLQDQPTSANAHIHAALLLGTIALNDYAGCFRDTRPALNRLTAHLAIADALGAAPSLPSRQLAEALRLTLCGQQADALALLGNTTDPLWQQPPFQSWTKLLKLRNTDDWRGQEAAVLAGPPALQREYFRALVNVVSTDNAIEFGSKLTSDLTAAYCAIANETGSLSVSGGHMLTKPWIGLEIKQAHDAAAYFGIATKDDKGTWIKFYLDTEPGSPVLLDDDRKPVIQVAGRNLFASYHQRHLLEAFNRTYAFLKENWGVPDQAQKVKESAQNQLPDLRYKPFLLRMLARTPAERESANAPCIALLHSQPQIVVPALWQALNFDHKGHELSFSLPDFHPWFHPEVPAGTAYDVSDRLYRIGVGDENDLPWLLTLRQRAPFSYPLASQIIFVENKRSYKNIPSDLITKWTTPLLDYESRPTQMMANAYQNQPGLYEQWMVRLAAYDSDAYLELADYFVERKMDEKAAAYYLIAFEKARNRVYFANVSGWIVRHLYAKGDTEKALTIAAEAAEVYSYRGLQTHLWLMEKLGRWDEAIDTAKKIDERYNDSSAEFVACLIRRKIALPETSDSPAQEQAITNVFPDGVRKASLLEFSGPPKAGVQIMADSREATKFGLKKNNIIVAFSRYRVETCAQYDVIRALEEDPHLRIIAWNGKEYVALEGDVPRRRFGVDMQNYAAK